MVPGVVVSRPLLEPLEPRALFSGDFSARISFAPEAAPDARGFRLDAGSGYGRRGNGLTYGWSSDKHADAVQVTSDYDNARLNAHINMDGGDTWSIAVPNGWYNLSALAGDPTRIDGDYRITAEGKAFVRGKPVEGFPFIEGRTTVQVTDGKLTLASATRSVNNRLCSIMIAETDAPAEVPNGAAINWSADSIASPTERVEAATAQVGDTLFVMGGFVDNYDGSTPRFDALNVKTGQWTRLADLPGPQTHMAAATDGRYIYTAGGQTGEAYSPDITAAVYRYDIARNRWQSFSRLPEIRVGGTMSVLNNQLHFVGGTDATLVTSQATHYVLDLDDPRAGWTEARPLPNAADHLGGIVVNGDWFVLGGENDHTTSYLARSDFYRYDARRDRWMTLPNMPTGLSHQEAGLLTDGVRIFTLAGMRDSQQMTPLVYSFDLRTGVWAEHTSMPAGRKGGFAWLEDGRFHYLTGEETGGGLPRGGYVGQIVGAQRVRR